VTRLYPSSQRYLLSVRFACRVLFDVQYPSLLRVPYPSARSLSLSLPAFDLCVACVEDAMFMLMCLVCVEDAMFNSQGHDEVVSSI